MVKKFFLLIVVLAFALFPIISATCTVTLDKTSYVIGETATAAMICTDQQEKSETYTLNWTFENGTSVELDTGTTPSVVSENFYQTFLIPSYWTNNTYVNATLQGDDLEGTDSALVSTTGSASSLLITNIGVGDRLVGLKTSIKARVTDENGKKISGGICRLGLLSNDESTVREGQTTIMADGETKGVFDLTPGSFAESTDYVFHIHCFCGSDGSSQECINEDGVAVENSVSSTTYPFTTSQWLTVNTVTDESLYGLKDEIFICANVTNLNYSKRIPLNIYYEIRCSAGEDNNNDTDRILIAYNSPEDPDMRGISTNTTQMQCRKFTIPEEFYLMGHISECYASSEVWVLDSTSEKIFGYATTSSRFNISSDEINLEADWDWSSDTQLNSIVNLSDFNDLSGTGTGNIDVRLFVGSKVDLRNIFDIANIISNITVQNTTSNLTQHTDYDLEFLEDGYVEIEIRDTDLASNWFNITLDFYDTELRQTVALEGIENKTGTFHLAVECPSYAAPGSDITCNLSAQVEDSQIVEKEVDFTCYLYDGSTNYNSLNFNQMINHTLFTTSKTITVPSTFTGTQNYVFQCEAGYYNLGSRIDYFYDSFITYISGASGSSGSTSDSSQPGGSITGGAILEPAEEEKEPETETTEDQGPLGIDAKAYNKILFSLAILAGLIFLILIISRLKNLFSEKKNIVFKKTFYLIFATFIMVALIGAIYYSANFLKSISLSETTALSDPLIRGIFLAFAIVIIIVILFKALNIRGEIKFGRDKIFDRYDKKLKHQERINKEILKKELHHMKNYRKK